MPPFSFKISNRGNDQQFTFSLTLHVVSFSVFRNRLLCLSIKYFEFYCLLLLVKASVSHFKFVGFCRIQLGGKRRRILLDYFVKDFNKDYRRSNYSEVVVMTTANSHENEIVVKHKGKFIAMVVCWLLGNGSLFAWNSMLTIEDYYSQIFPKYHPTRVLTLVYQPFAFVTLAIFLYYEAKVNTRVRNLIGFSLFFLSSVLLIIIDVATSGGGGIGPFLGVCISSAIFGIADALAQGGMVGDLSLMCPEFIQSFFAGLAASGVFTSALRFITKAAFDNSENGLRKGATLFFALSAFIELLCVLLYAFVFPKLPIVKYYRAKAAKEGSKTVAADLIAGGVSAQNRQQLQADEDPKQPERLSIKHLLLENLDYGLDLYLIYVLTLSIFPGFLSEDTGTHSLGSWYVLVLIAMYNVWDLIGRYTPLIEFIRIESRKGLMLIIISRFLFIPAFYFTAKYGTQGYMIMLTSLLGLTNGHLTVCAITAAPKGYTGPEQNALGNILVLFLLGGLLSGVTLDWLWLIGKGW